MNALSKMTWCRWINSSNMMKTPSFYPLMETMLYLPRYPYFVTGWGHHKIEPKAKHLSYCKKNQSSWPNETDNSKRNTKIPNHAYKNSEKNQIIFIDKLVHKSTIHRISANTPQKSINRIDLQEHRGELCIENQRERRSHLANNYGPKGLR